MSVLLLAILGLALTLAPALVSAQVAGLGVGITPAFDSPVTVGEVAPAEPAWDDWVGTRWPVVPTATVVEPAFVEPVQPVIIQPVEGDDPGTIDPVVPGPHVEPIPVEPVPAEPETAEPVADAADVLVPTVVPRVASTNGLDPAALDAAQALSEPARPTGPPAGRRRGRR